MANNIINKRVKDLRFNHCTDPTYDWESLEKSLYFEGYDPKKYGYIRVHKNRVINGNHRLQIITRSKSNMEKCIKVQSVTDFNYFTGLFVALLFMPVYLPIMLFPAVLRKLGILKPLKKYRRSGKYYKPGVYGSPLKIWKQ